MDGGIMDKRAEERERLHREAEDIELMYWEHGLVGLGDVITEGERRRG
jgi:hypothetical protein